jgi:hypothetical protein
MIRTMAEELPKVLKEEDVTYNDIYKAFKMPVPEESLLDQKVASVISQAIALKTCHYKSIREIKKQDWSAAFSNKGTFDVEGLELLEASFRNNELPENNWKFDYLIINDVCTGRPVVASFLTTALWKDDMLAPAPVSESVELKRVEDPYYFTSTVLSTGSLLTEGEHIYIDKSSPFWKDAMRLFFDAVTQLQEKYNANSIVLRDFQQVDEEFETLLIDNGYFKISMPDNHIVNELSWNDPEEFYQSLSKRSRQHFREDVKRYVHQYDVCVEHNPTEQDIDEWYGLYKNVKNNSLELNTFALPKKLFINIAKDPSWEVLTLKLNTGTTGGRKTVCVVFSHTAGTHYTPMIIGIDYAFNKAYKVYRQALYRLVMRAKNLGKRSIHLGFSASVEKKKVGAVVYPTYAFMQIRDSYHAEVLANMAIARKNQ